MAISTEREQHLRDSFFAETNDPETQEWREDLTAEETAMVETWDEKFDTGISKMASDSLRIQKRNKLISECRDFGIEYAPDNPLCQTFENITQKTSYNSFKIWALKLPTDNPDLQDCERDTALRISDLSPDELKREYLIFNQVYWLSGEHMKCDDPNFTFATIHTPAMEKLNNSLPAYKAANRQYDFDDFGQEYNHYLGFRGTLRRAEKYGVDTSEFKKFVAKTYQQSLTPEIQEPKKSEHKKDNLCI